MKKKKRYKSCDCDMSSKKLIKYFSIGSLATCGFLAGIYTERKRHLCNNDHLNIKNMPGLPMFGTVSAASPYTPVPVPTDPSITAPEIKTHTSRVSQIMKYGFPSLDQVRSFNDYVLSYDRRNRVAHWVFEHLTKESVKHNSLVDRSKCEFKPDDSIHKYFR